MKRQTVQGLYIKSRLAGISKEAAAMRAMSQLLPAQLTIASRINGEVERLIRKIICMYESGVMITH